MKLGNYVTGKWVEGDGNGKPLYNVLMEWRSITALH